MARAVRVTRVARVARLARVGGGKGTGSPSADGVRPFVVAAVAGNVAAGRAGVTGITVPPGGGLLAQFPAPLVVVGVVGYLRVHVRQVAACLGARGTARCMGGGGWSTTDLAGLGGVSA
ncbi:hypothetical protein GCM10022227_50040 [Streptomyces sedi]